MQKSATEHQNHKLGLFMFPLTGVRRKYSEQEDNETG